MKGISNTFLQNEALPSLDDWSPDMITPYSGSDRKEGLISPDGTRYLVKYAEAQTRGTGWKMESIIRKMILNRNITKCMLQRKVIRLHYNEQGLSENIPGQPLRSPLFHLPQHFLYFFPLPQGQGSFLPIFGWILLYVSSPSVKCTGPFFFSSCLS